MDALERHLPEAQGENVPTAVPKCLFPEQSVIAQAPEKEDTLEIGDDGLFLLHPDPMWIFDRETLRFIAVNSAAIARYGYSREEFLGMTIADIRPDSERDKLAQRLAEMPQGLRDSGVWRHLLKSGEIVYVKITGNSCLYGGRNAELIVARDVTDLVIAEQAAREALDREQQARRSSEALARQFQLMFDSVPGVFLVYAPETLDILAVSASALVAFDVRRDDVLGRPLTDALPFWPHEMTLTSLKASMQRAGETGAADLLEIQRVMVPEAGDGDRACERLWAMTNAPVAGSDGKPLYFMLRIEDVTDAVREAPNAFPAGTDPPEARSRLDLVAHTRALKTDNLRLTELASQFRSQQRLLEAGTWAYVIDEDRLEWSSSVYEMYGVTRETFGHRSRDYVALIHPDDRAAVLESFVTFLESNERQISFSHQVVHKTGRVVHVHGLAERVETPSGTVLSGAIQNVTTRIAAARDLSRAKRMLEIAGASARFGAWRYDVLTSRLEWSDQTARLHGEPDGFSPSREEGVAYYAPEYRERISRLFETCIVTGAPFAEILEIISAKGRRFWIRTTGEAERDATGRIVAVHGSFQDIDELVMIRKRAEASERLLEIAGRAARLGGWSVDLKDRKISWTDGVALLHELPPGTEPSYEAALDFFAPEDRAGVWTDFERCTTAGTPFDSVRDLITAEGNRIKVRLIGECVRDDAGTIIALRGAMQDVTALTNAERRADELTTNLAVTLESMGDAFIMMDREWRFTYVNHTAEEVLDRRRDDLIGRKVLDAFPAAAGSPFETNLAQALARNESVRFEEYFEPLDRVFRVNVHPAPTGLAVYFTDVTEQLNRTEQLRLLASAIARINDIIIITEVGTSPDAADTKIVYVNDAFERGTGFTRDEAIGQNPRILQGPGTDRTELARIRTALVTFTPVRTELINYTKSGEPYWIELDIVPVADETGKFTHFVSVQHDITERRNIEEALRLSETRFHLIARSTGTAVWENDPSGQRQWLTDGIGTIFGYDAAGMAHAAWEANVHPDDRQRVAHALDKLTSGGSGAIEERYRFRRADGSWASVEERAFAVRDAEDQTIRVLGSMTDISDRLLLEDRIHQSQKMEAVGQLTGGIAHDFNNLLTIIMGNTELLQDGLAPGNPLRPYAEMSAKAADRAAELTSRLLVFSRQQALAPKVINANAAIVGLEGMLRRTLGEVIDIVIAGVPDLWRIEADQGQLEATLLNLAINSRDAMPDGGKLTIESANIRLDDTYVAGEPGLASGDYVVIAVSDTGTGIPSDLIDRVFEPFFTTKAVGRGTGLGLAMVYGFVKQTGGHIRVYSEVNEGTTVKLYFPRYRGDDVVSEAVPPPLTAAPGQGTILVVEDDTLILQQLATQLEGLGYTAIPATSGPMALAILSDRPEIDLLLTDVVLPGGMNGRQIADEALRLRPRLRVLYTSGYSENAIVHHGRLDKGIELLTKPYRRSELATKVRKALDTPAQQG